jgi:molecular chaperone GrpE
MTSNTYQGTYDIDDNGEEMKDGDASDADARSANGKPEVEALRADLAEMQDRWLRSEAEIAKVRTRAKRDVEETRQFAVQKFASDVVEAAQNLRRGLNNLPAVAEGEPRSMAALRSGLSEIERGFVSLLERNGIKAEDPIGSVFSPDLHQPIGEREALGQSPGTVLQTLSPVWTLNGRLLRPAMVVVAKSPSVSSADSSHPDDAEIQ